MIDDESWMMIIIRSFTWSLLSRFALLLVRSDGPPDTCVIVAAERIRRIALYKFLLIPPVSLLIPVSLLARLHAMYNMGFFLVLPIVIVRVCD